MRRQRGTHRKSVCGRGGNTQMWRERRHVHRGITWWGVHAAMESAARERR